MNQSLLKVISDRTISSFGISIGTGIMLESMFDPTTERYDTDRDIPDNVKPDHYDKHYFNIYTLARNLIGAMSVKVEPAILYKDETLLVEVLNEVNNISLLYEDTKCTPVLFVPKYDMVYKEFNKNKNVEITDAEYLLQQYLIHMINASEYAVNMSVVANTHKLPVTQSRVLITTHLPIDLLNYRSVPKLELLESHTGKLKDRKLWYTKYHKLGARHLEMFPFTEELVYLLGLPKMVRVMKLVLRRQLHDYAIERKWTSRTNHSTIRTDLLKKEEFKTLIMSKRNIY